MGFVGIHVGSSIRVIVVQLGWICMMVGTGVGAIIIIIIIGKTVSIVIIVTIVSVPIVIITVDTDSAHVGVVVGPRTVDCIPFTIIVRFTTVVGTIITAIINPASIISAITGRMIMSNTFLCCMILGVLNCGTNDPLTSSVCLYGSTRWGGSASIFFKGARWCRAVYVGVVDIVDIRIGVGDVVIIVGCNVIVTIVTIIIIDIASRIVIVIVRILDSAIIA